jgi:hypothetical protein
MSAVMTFLKKAGTLLVNGVSLVELGYPILGKLVPAKAQPVVNTIVSDLEQFAGTVTTVETMANAIPAGLTGEQKLAASLPGIAQAVAQSSVMLGKKIADNAMFQKAVTEYAQASVDLLNSLSPETLPAK